MRPLAAGILHRNARRLLTTIYERKRQALGTSKRYLRVEPLLPGTHGHDFYVPAGKYFGHMLREIRKTHR